VVGHTSDLATAVRTEIPISEVVRDWRPPLPARQGAGPAGETPPVLDVVESSTAIVEEPANLVRYAQAIESRTVPKSESKAIEGPPMSGVLIRVDSPVGSRIKMRLSILCECLGCCSEARMSDESEERQC
jgi:hypothetical protein